jgi:hypothetical protein
MFNPVYVYDYAVDTSDNLVVYHFIVDLENSVIKARAIAVSDPEGCFILPVDEKMYLVNLPNEVIKNPRSLVMQEDRDVFLELPILNIYSSD